MMMMFLSTNEFLVKKKRITITALGELNTIMMSRMQHHRWCCSLEAVDDDHAVR